MAKLITVCGATGMQGGGVVRALVAQPEVFKVRGVSRNIESEKAKALTRIGVEMVQASYDDVASMERAMEGSHGVFAVTNYDEYLDSVREEQQGKNIVDAAKKVGVKHLIFSSTPSALKVYGKIIPPMEGKAKAEEYMFASGLPATAVWYAFYFENILNGLKPKKVAKDEFVWEVPMEGKPLVTVGMTTAGAAVAAIFKNPNEYIGRVVALGSDCKTIQEYCDDVNKYISPKKLKATTMTAVEFGEQDLGPMTEDFARYYEMEQRGLVTSGGLSNVKRLVSDVMDFEEYVKQNKDEFLAMLQEME